MRFTPTVGRNKTRTQSPAPFFGQEPRTFLLSLYDNNEVVCLSKGKYHLSLVIIKAFKGKKHIQCPAVKRGKSRKGSFLGLHPLLPKRPPKELTVLQRNSLKQINGEKKA